MGGSLRQKTKGTPLGQLLSHPGCFEIKKIYINKNHDVARSLTQELIAEGGACFLPCGGSSEMWKTLHQRKAKRCVVLDLRTSAFENHGLVKCRPSDRMEDEEADDKLIATVPVDQRQGQSSSSSNIQPASQTPSVRAPLMPEMNFFVSFCFVCRYWLRPGAIS